MTPSSKRLALHGWGHTQRRHCHAWRPEKRRELEEALQQEGPKLARGLGRSYGDASLQPDGVVLTERLNHFIAFDDRRGVAQAQAGVTLAELMDISVPRGWFPPVLPGTRHVTLGGALACNIHGKNHWREGDFAEHVASIRLRLADGQAIICSPTQHRDIFWATAGGMGMTGIIEEVTLKLRRIASASLSATAYRVASLVEMLASFEEHRGSADYMVGWIDHAARDGDLGRGVFEAASHIDLESGGEPLDAYAPPRPGVTVPFFLPGLALNRHTMALYNAWRFKRHSAWREARNCDFNGFFHPLDRIGRWYRLYGRRGFFQYQCLFPDAPDVAERMKTFLAAIHQKKLFSFLAVIKYHREGKGFLTFSQEGYSIALDFPNTRRARALLPQLDRWVADHGGRVYLAKDALLAPELFDVMYGTLGREWRGIVNGLDPQAKFTSLMSQRLQWKSRPAAG